MSIQRSNGILRKSDKLALAEGLEYNNGAKSSISTEVLGWDTPSVTMETVPALFKPGSYIVSQRIEERNIEVTYNYDDEKRVILQRNTLVMAAFEEVTIYREYSENGAIFRREEMDGYIVSIPTFDAIDASNTVKYTILCTNPMKRVYLNGSTTEFTESL